MKTTSRFFSFLASLSILIILPFLFQTSSALAQTTAPNSGAGTNNSYNWSGYLAAAGNYTGVNGTWTIPQISPLPNLTGDATWTGIGGVNSSDLIQVGTQALTGGTTTAYQAWYEMLPSFSQPISITVNPGDSITASILESSAGQWTLSLRDNTNGQNFQTVVPYNSSMNSAEWIEEMPSQGNGAFIPLDSFGNVQFTGATVIQNGQTLTASQAGASEMTMINSGGQALATPSGLGSDGASFNVSRSGAAPSSAPGISPMGRRGWSRVGVGVQGFSGFGKNPGSGRSQRGFYRMRVRFFTRFSFER